MPSIPQSLLWISLVVLWLFVLVPMLINKRDTVRRTSDVALATRVSTPPGRRLLRRGGPAAGHRSDPDWRAGRGRRRRTSTSEPTTKRRSGGGRRQPGGASSPTAEPDYLDVDIVEEDSGALPVGESAAQAADGNRRAETEDGSRRGCRRDRRGAATGSSMPTTAKMPGTRAGRHCRRVRVRRRLLGPGGTVDADLQLADSMTAARRRRYESKTAAAVSARKYRFRKRMLALMAVSLVASAAAAFTVAPAGAWWACGTVGAVTVAVSGLSAPPDPHRGAVAAPSHPAHGAVAAGRGEHRRPRVRRRAVAAAPARVRRCWRSTTRTRCSSISTTRRSRGNTTCRVRRASDRRFRPVRRWTGSRATDKGLWRSW